MSFIFFPVLTVHAALPLGMDILCCSGAAVGFIASFYLWPCERLFFRTGLNSLKRATEDASVYIDRDSDATIQRRSLSFLQCCVLSGAYLYARSPARSVVGQQSGSSLPLWRALGSTVVLFAGPLADKTMLRHFALEDSWLRRLRSYVVCPLGEELFFRGVLFSLLSARGEKTQIGVAALLFALSHSHHVVSWACDAYLDTEDCGSESAGDAAATEDTLAVQRACWRVAARKMGYVILFTGIFGVLSGYYYLHVCEGSIPAIAAVHAFCNLMGPPEFAVLRSPHTSSLSKAVSAAVYLAGVIGWSCSLLH